MTGDDLPRRPILFTMLTACAWRDTPAGPTPVVAGLRTFPGGRLGIGRIVVGMACQGYDLLLTRYGEEDWRATFYLRAGGIPSRRRSGQRGSVSHGRRRSGPRGRACGGGKPRRRP